MILVEICIALAVHLIVNAIFIYNKTILTLFLLSSMMFYKNTSKFDFFVFIKSITMIVCVLLYLLLNNNHSPLIEKSLLILNIFEAFMVEICNKQYIDSIVACMLIISLVFINVTNNEKYYLSYELPYYWIIIYTSWNMIFVYHNNMSLMTQLILFVPLMMSLIIDKDVWLISRTLSLFTHLIFRYYHLFIFYKEGKTMLTPLEGTINNKYCVYISILNIVLSIYLICCNIVIE